MEFLICEKHKKVEKIGTKVNTNGYVCMNRYCPDAFKVFCSTCKNDHRDHAIKILTIEDTTFLIERLLKQPFKEPNHYIGEALDVMKKLKLIKQFRKKIDILEKEIQKEALKLIDSTESLIYEYNMCKEGAQNLAALLSNAEKPDVYKQFFQNSQHLLSNLDYNFKKDKMEFGNALTKEKEDKRRKTFQQSKRKIQQVRDYSMKIIEVILHTNESDDEQEDFSYIKKHYEMLRNELSQQKGEEELDNQISELKGSKSTSNKSRIKKNLLDGESQTSQAINFEEIASVYESKIKELIETNQKNESQLKTRLSEVSSEKQNLSRELNSWKKKYQDKRKNIKDLEISLRDNRIKRVNKQKSRQEMVTKIIDLCQLKGGQSDDKND